MGGILSPFVCMFLFTYIKNPNISCSQPEKHSFFVEVAGAEHTWVEPFCTFEDANEANCGVSVHTSSHNADSANTLNQRLCPGGELGWTGVILCIHFVIHWAVYHPESCSSHPSVINTPCHEHRLSVLSQTPPLHLHHPPSISHTCFPFCWSPPLFNPGSSHTPCPMHRGRLSCCPVLPPPPSPPPDLSACLPTYLPACLSVFCWCWALTSAPGLQGPAALQ